MIWFKKKWKIRKLVKDLKDEIKILKRIAKDKDKKIESLKAKNRFYQKCFSKIKDKENQIDAIAHRFKSYSNKERDRVLYENQRIHTDSDDLEIISISLDKFRDKIHKKGIDDIN
jgi:hypothetical protein